MKKHLLFTVISFVIALIFSIAYFCPVQNIKRYIPVGDSIRTLSQSDISRINSCDITASGEILITGEDPYIVFEHVNEKIQGVAWFTDGVFSNNISAQLYVDTGEGFDEYNSQREAAFAGTSFICFAVPEQTVQSIRLDFNNNTGAVLDSIELYEETPKLEWMKEMPAFSETLLAVVVALLLAGIAFLVEVRFDITGIIADTVKKNYMKVLIFVSGSVVFCLFGIVIEFVLSHVGLDALAAGDGFNRYRCLFICHAFLIIYAFVWFRKDIGEKPEKLFLAILLIAGSMMITVSPFGWNSWDTGVHYTWASNASFFNEANVTRADYLFTQMDVPVKMKESLEQNTEAIEEMNECYYNVIDYSSTETTIAHRLSGLLMAVARMSGCSFYEIYLIGEYAILLIYAVVCFLAMRKLNSGKMVLAIVALLPTSMFLATNYSYDYWVTCFSLLGMAYYLSEMQKPDQPVSVKNTLIMAGAFAIASLPKINYVTLLTIPFLMRKKDLSKKDSRKYYGICSSIVIVLVVVLLMVTLREAGGSGDLRGGSDVNPAGQIAYILHNPLIYAGDLVKFVLSYLAPYNANQYMVHFANFGIGAGSVIILFLMIFTSVTDKKECDKISSNWVMRAIIVIVFIGSVVFIATTLYVLFTPVGSRVINGCQPRYLIPLLFPLLSVIAGSGVKFKLKQSWYNGVVMGIMTVLLCYNVCVLELSHLI